MQSQSENIHAKNVTFATVPVGSVLRFATWFACTTLLQVVFGCASSGTAPTPPTDQVTASNANAASSQTGLVRQLEENDSARLDQIWKARVIDSDDSHSSSFALGPGDVLKISAPPIEPRTVRVSEENTIDLPLIGEINVAGMTEKDLREAVSSRMAKYRRHPEVGVFLERAEDRQVAVLGAVKTPGRYMLTSRSDTLMTAISRAGGVTNGAASRIFLIPASTREPGSNREPGSKGATTTVRDAAGGGPTLMASSDGSREIEGGAQAVSAATRLPTGPDLASAWPKDDPLEIDTSEPTGQRYLEIPARPGDVVLVPLAGDVTVQGWVQKPGSFPVTPKMTVLNAIAAAGGPQFTSSATLLRESPNGSKQSMALDLSKMKRGEQGDPPVQGGDVVIVDRSVVGAVPYSAYFLISHVGFGIPLF